MASQLLLELSRVARRTADRVRSRLAHARRSQRPRLAHWVHCSGSAARIAGVHLKGNQKRRGSERNERGTSMNHQCEVYTGEAITADSRQSAFVNARRVHKALTADLEKRLLVWMAQRTPATINSDDLTALGFVSQVLAGITYAF